MRRLATAGSSSPAVSSLAPASLEMPRFSAAAGGGSSVSSSAAALGAVPGKRTPPRASIWQYKRSLGEWISFSGANSMPKCVAGETSWPAEEARATRRRETCNTDDECPPKARKWSFGPMFARPSTSPQTSATTCSSAVREEGAEAATSTTSGSCLLSTLPFGVRGSRCMRTKRLGSMCLGSSRLLCCSKKSLTTGRTQKGSCIMTAASGETWP
mmetsp:Transcript_142655/g.371773  ORF Transcript_142655/g.371773 Transcript_142655/m.371773 type:complete len:214 (-) Transcript_142655:1319-1960(-)